MAGIWRGDTAGDMVVCRSCVLALARRSIRSWANRQHNTVQASRTKASHVATHGRGYTKDTHHHCRTSTHCPAAGMAVKRLPSWAAVLLFAAAGIALSVWRYTALAAESHSAARAAFTTQFTGDAEGFVDFFNDRLGILAVAADAVSAWNTLPSPDMFDRVRRPRVRREIHLVVHRQRACARVAQRWPLTAARWEGAHRVSLRRDVSPRSNPQRFIKCLRAQRGHAR